MDNLQRDQWIQRLKSAPIGIGEAGTLPAPFGRDQIAQMLPHRDPFALIDRIVAVDIDGLSIATETDIVSDDPVFTGHFPDQPLYPGVLQIEMMGQAGLCLFYFLKNGMTPAAPENRPVKGLFTRVHHASFIQAVLPGDTTTVLATVIMHDEFFGILGVQLCKGRQICSYGIVEAYFIE